MPTINELVTSYQKQVTQLTVLQTKEIPNLRFLDCREVDEVKTGLIPSALWIAKGQVDLRIEKEIPTKYQPIVVYCASGFRSVLVAKGLQDLGYSKIFSLIGGIQEWKAQGGAIEKFKTVDLNATRYKAHLALPEIGHAGQVKLQQSRVLIIGAGGLGSPIALYLAAAGIGRIGIVDSDLIDESNLQRQILHTTDRIGLSKVNSAYLTLKNLNPNVQVEVYNERFDADNADRIVSQYDIVIDGCDNFQTRYLVNQACLKNNKINIHGSVLGFQGQVTLLCTETGPCYRCIFENPPSGELASNCADGGVLGPLVGVIGTLVAVECVKHILNLGESLEGRLLHFDSLDGRFDELKVKKNPDCPSCAHRSLIKDYNKELEFIEVCLRK